jgi:Fe-S cluster assembly protein SufA
MMLCPGGSTDEVELWNCIQKPSILPTLPRGLTLTPAAAAHIHELVAKNPDILGLRLGVKQTGCAGFGYVLDTVTQAEKDDLVFETEGARLYVALQAMPFIDGTEVDYVREGCLNQLTCSLSIAL